MDLDDDLVGGAVDKGLTRRKFAPKTAKPKPSIQVHNQVKSGPRDSAPASGKKEQSDDLKIGSSNGSMKIEMEAAKPLEPIRSPDLSRFEHVNIDMSGNGVQDEEEDMVVRSIDVFLNSSVDTETQLYIMQYPLRPSWRPYELDSRCEEVRIKSGSSEMEIDLAVDNSTNWDAEVATRMDYKKQVLCARCETEPLNNTIAVAVLTNNELYLNPVHSVVQFRPSLEHLNQEKGKRKNQCLSDGDATMKIDGHSESKSMLLTNKQTWIPLKYYGATSDFSASYLKKMVTKESSHIVFNLKPNEYLKSMCPMPPDNKKSIGHSMRLLFLLPYEERIKKLLLEGAPVKRYSTLQRFATDCSAEELLNILQKFGLLVQGLWVPKTSIIQFSSPDERTYGPLARDYVLLLFSNGLVVSSSHFDVGPQKFREQVKIIRKFFSVQLDSSRNWKLKGIRDISFIEQFPEIVAKQNAIWGRVAKDINDNINRMSRASVMKNDIARHSLVHHAKLPKTTVGVEKVARASSKRMITDEIRDALLKALPKVLHNYKVCSFELICHGLRDLAISQSTLPKADPRMAVAAASAADAPPSELQEVIGEIATNIHGFYVLKSSPDHPEYDALRAVVIDLFLSRGANAKIKKNEILAAARSALKREVSSNEYSKVMTDICRSIDAAWTLKSGDGRP